MVKIFPTPKSRVKVVVEQVWAHRRFAVVRASAPTHHDHISWLARMQIPPGPCIECFACGVGSEGGYLARGDVLAECMKGSNISSRSGVQLLDLTVRHVAKARVLAHIEQQRN